MINLSLVECPNAKEAVIQGLKDPHRSVRIAAAFNAGLYCDSDVVNALELFFERHRPLLVLDGVCVSGSQTVVTVDEKVGESIQPVLSSR